MPHHYVWLSEYERATSRWGGEAAATLMHGVGLGKAPHYLDQRKKEKSESEREKEREKERDNTIYLKKSDRIFLFKKKDVIK
jgi:hypothetical protein